MLNAQQIQSENFNIPHHFKEKIRALKYIVIQNKWANELMMIHFKHRSFL